MVNTKFRFFAANPLHWGSHNNPPLEGQGGTFGGEVSHPVQVIGKGWEAVLQAYLLLFHPKGSQQGCALFSLSRLVRRT